MMEGVGSLLLGMTTGRVFSPRTWRWGLRRTLVEYRWFQPFWSHRLPRSIFGEKAAILADKVQLEGKLRAPHSYVIILFE